MVLHFPKQTKLVEPLDLRLCRKMRDFPPTDRRQPHLGCWRSSGNCRPLQHEWELEPLAHLPVQHPKDITAQDSLTAEMPNPVQDNRRVPRMFPKLGAHPKSGARS